MFVLSGRQINTVIQIAAMACDIMSIPISIVTSESAFSIGGDVLDQYRSSLKPNTVEAIMCRRDWLVGAAIGKLMSHLLINFCLFDFPFSFFFFFFFLCVYFFSVVFLFWVFAFKFVMVGLCWFW